MRFLAVDDDQFSIDLLKKNLGEHGHGDVTTFLSAKSTLDHLDAVHQPNEAVCHYDCLLVDIQMPEMDGVELCIELRKRSYCLSVPIIMVTSLKAREDVTRAISAGATDYIVKPVNSVDLVSRISAASAIVHEQRSVLDQYIRFVTEEMSPVTRGASYDLPFNAAEAENFINYRSMEKYLSALHEDDARQVSALAFRIDEESLAKEAVSDDRFLRINRRVARKFSRNLPGEQSFFTYVGRGTFIVMFDKVLVSNILKAVEFVEQRFHAEKAYPKLKFVKGRVTEINALHDRAEDLLLQTLATLDLSDRRPMAVSENIPQRVASVWARLFGTKSAASQEPVASMEDMRRRYVVRLGQDVSELREAIGLVVNDQPSEEGLRFIASHAHRTSGVAGTLGFESLGAVAASLDSLLAGLMSSGENPRIDDDTRVQLEKYLQHCEQASENSEIAGSQLSSAVGSN